MFIIILDYRTSSFVEPQQILVHFDGIYIPNHLCLCHWGHSPQILEETIGHFLIKLSQCGLHFPFEPLDDLDDIFGAVGHVLAELELRPHVFLLVELHVAGLEEVAPDGDAALDRPLGDLPPGDPLASVEVAQLDVLACYAQIHVQRLLRQVHEH